MPAKPTLDFDRLYATSNHTCRAYILGASHCKQHTFMAIMLLLLGIRVNTSITYAASFAQDNAITQCAEGVRLYLSGKSTEAYPLLEAGFVGRERVTFVRPADLGYCALGLAALRSTMSDQRGALEAYTVALNAFQRSGDKKMQGIALNKIGGIYNGQAQYTKAKEYFQQALTIEKAVSDQASEGESLNGIGSVYLALGQYAQALENFQQALTIRRAVKDQIGEGITLNNIGLIYDGQAQYSKALETYQQALTLERAVGDRKMEGTTLNNMGAIYYAQGQYAKAIESSQQALTIAQTMRDQVGEGFILTGIGLIYWSQGQYTKALEYEQKALTIHHALKNSDSEGATLNNIGVIYRSQGHYVQALQYMEQALTLARTVSDRVMEGKTLNNIGSLSEAQGQYAKALNKFQQALTIAQAVGDPAMEGTVLHNIANIYTLQGQYAQALNNYEHALSIAQAISDQAGKGVTLDNMAMVYAAQGQYAKALEYLQQALTIFQEPSNPVGEGAVLGNIGKVYWDQGQYMKALEYLQRALTIRRAVGDRAGEAITLNNISGVYWKQGKYVQALDYLQQALKLVQALNDQTDEGATLNNIGAVYEEQGQYVQALTYYTQAMDTLEAVRAIAGSEQGRVSFIAQYNSLYDRAAALYHRQGQNDLAFVTSERGRARAFLDSLATGKVQLSDQNISNLLASEQESYTIHQVVQDALGRARAASPPDPKLIASLEQQLKNTEQQHAASLAEIEKQGPQLASLVPSRTKSVLTLPEVQKLLDGQTTLVAYDVLPDQTLAFIITHDHFQTVALSVPSADLITQIQILREFANTSEAHPASTLKLYDWLIAPLKSYLTTSHLVIVPHGVLHYLPFAALTDGKRFLIDDYTLITLPSVSALQFIKARSPLTNTVPLIIGNPTTMNANLKPLAYAEQEAQAIAKLYDVTPLLGAAATTTVVRQRAAQANILHLAVHGSYNISDTLASTLYLAPGATITDTGHLTVRDIYSWKLNATNLVVLSACETQMNELSERNIVSAGDDIVGLTRAFFFAGAPSVLATLWSVDDQPTEQLMEQFYTNLRSGMSKAEALRQAQLTIRQDYPNPYYWAGFVLSGDGGPLIPASSKGRQ